MTDIDTSVNMGFAEGTYVSGNPFERLIERVHARMGQEIQCSDTSEPSPVFTLLVISLARADKYLAQINVFLKDSKRKVGLNGR